MNQLRMTISLTTNNIDQVDKNLPILHIETQQPNKQSNYQHVLPTQTKPSTTCCCPRQDGKSLTFTHSSTICTNTESTQAYDKYQERKASKQIQQVGFEQERSPSPELLEYQANNEILEKAGISPPSYNDVVVHRVEIPNSSEGLPKYGATGEKGLIEDLTYSESIDDVPNGLQAPNGYRGPAQSAYVEAPARRGCSARQNYEYSSRCEQKRAEKMARKAEKQAAKLVKAQAHM